MEILKAAPELLAEYFTFLIRFTANPLKVVADTMQGDDEPRLSAKLITFSLLSVGVAIIVVRIGQAVGMADDKSWTVTVAGRLDEKFLPLAVLLVTIGFSVATHVILTIVGLVARVLGNEPFAGRLVSSVNAGTAFATWSIPLITAVIVAVRIAAANARLDPLVFLIVVVPLAIAFWAYLVAAFAGAHRIKVQHAASLFALTIAILVLVQNLF